MRTHLFTGLLFLQSSLLLSLFSSGQTNFKPIIEKEIVNIKTIPSFTHPDFQGTKEPLTIFDSSYTKIVSLGIGAIPVLINKLYDTTFITPRNPCWEGEAMRTRDIAWFLINEIEPIPAFPALGLVICTQGSCSHFPQGFFNFIHNDPILYANRYKKYFNNKQRKLGTQK